MIPTARPKIPRMYINSPTVVFAAQVNLTDPIEYPVAFLSYNNVTVGDYTDIEVGMLLCLGLTPGGSELGRQRVTPNSTNIVIRTGYSSRGTRDGELLVVDNAFITVYDDRRIWAKLPFIDAAGEVFKDRNIAVGDNNENPPPVAVMRAGAAGTAVDGELLVQHTAQGSYPVADGATLSSRLWDIKDGTLVAGTLTDETITVSYPPGFRHPSLTVTDSNGKSHTTWRPVFVDDPDNRQSISRFTIEGHGFSDDGQSMSVRILTDLPRATYLDGAEVLIWDDEPGGTADRDHMVFIGWLATEQISLQMQETGFVANTVVRLADVGARLRTLPGFTQLLQDEILRDEEIDPETTWQFMPLPTIDKFTHFIIHWHCNVLDETDVILSGTGEDYPFVQLQAGGTSLLDQIKRLASMIVPDYRLKITTLGELKILPDPMVLNVADRTELVMVELEEDEWQEVSWQYDRDPQYHVLWGNATLTATNYVVVGDDEVISTVKSIAPGQVYGQGLSERTHIEQLAQSQAALNMVTGHRYARINSRYGPLTARLPGDIARREFDHTNDGWVLLHIPAERAAQRGLDSTLIRGRLISGGIDWGFEETGRTQDAIITVEVETSGEPAYTWNPGTGIEPPDDGDWEPPVPVEPPLVTIPPDSGLIPGQQLMAGIDRNGKLYITTDFQTPDSMGGPTWTEVDLGITEQVFSFVVDPFSEGYIGTTGPIDCFLATETDIYRVTDLFGTPITTSIHTFAETALTRTIQASFGAFFPVADENPWLICVSYYGDLSGHTGTWATRSLDSGSTWETEVEISADYDSGGAVNPIGVYTSPKTPGKALTAAHVPLATGPMPRWGVWDDETSTWTLGDLAASATMVNNTTNTGGAVTTYRKFLVLAPPVDAVRVEYELVWTVTKSGTGIILTDLAIEDEIQTTQTNDHDGVNRTATETVVVTGSASLTSGTDWPWNRDVVVATPPTNEEGLRFNLYSSADATSPPTAVFCDSSITVIVKEIELDSGLIYNPSLTEVTEGKVSEDWGETWDSEPLIEPLNGQAGAIHVPWPDNALENLIFFGALDREGNRQFKLRRLTGALLEDIGPNLAGFNYGINHGHFSVRTHDSNRTFVVAGMTANDTSASDADDRQSVFVSSTGGDSWTSIITPVVTPLPFHAAFGGESEDEIYIWGPASYISYSDDFGATLDDRSGNLASFSPQGFLGIAGGPTP